MAIGKARKIAKYVEDSTLPDGYKFVPADTVSHSNYHYAYLD
jgi:hypothetical protein